MRLRQTWPSLIVGVLLTIIAAALAPKLGVGALAFVVGLSVVLIVAYLTYTNPTVGLLAMIFLLPFERVGSIELAGFTLRTSQVIGALLLFVFILSVVLRRAGRVRPNPTVWLGALLILIAVLSMTQAVNGFRAATVLTFVGFTIVVSWLVPHFVTNTAVLRRSVIVLGVSTALVCAFGLFQFAGDLVGLPPSLTGLRDLYTSEVFGFPRIQSTFLEPLYFANFLLIPLGILISLLLAGQKVVRPIWLLALTLLAGVNFVLTLSRGGYIALAFSLLVLAVVYWRKVLAPHRVLLGVLVLAVIVWGASQFLGLTGDRQESIDTFSRQATGIFTGASYTDRATTFEDAWAMAQARPWLGVGIGNFGPNVADFPLVQPEQGWLIVNNEFLEVLAELGIFGFSTFLLLLLVLFIRTIRAIRFARDPFVRAVLVGLLAAFVGVIVQYQTFSILYIMHIWFLFGLMVAAQNIAFDRTTDHA